MFNHNPFLKIGDWVKGESRDGQLIIGYIENLNHIEDLVSIKIVTSDKEETIGKTVQMLTHQVKSLPAATVNNKEQIRALIDLALSTGDEEWFLELTAKLKSMEQLVKEAIY
ncbi:group-specific protein [Mesobacillus campisalis]|uniref:Group-specific protein n=1 Tax=Mesobacillus campisalis TaxID=1408103 RepID=A0A0M2SWT2_9BACI|nr:IDEAL domain-containing protein [Mesobacillus campisalis]KKK38628.1 group-specific protein [Mesobacillus campisalis]